MTAVKATDPAATIRTEVFGREPMYNDAAEICTGVLVTYGVAGNPWLALAALPVVTLLQRSLRHVQLLNDSRADSKTGLLNAATWEREATAEVGRAVRTRTPLAVAMLDIDRFKVINDTYGHLAGDQVLKEIARALDSLLRDYDRAGRFGGEEFSLLLPQTRAVDAFRIAERVRANIAGLSIIVPGASGGERVHVTVSIGVAALDSGQQARVLRTDGGRRRRPVPGEGRWPGPGADDQHDPGPERHQRRWRHGPHRRRRQGRPPGRAERVPPRADFLIRAPRLARLDVG